MHTRLNGCRELRNVDCEERQSEVFDDVIPDHAIIQ
jgi:hypothetical protein